MFCKATAAMNIVPSGGPGQSKWELSRKTSSFEVPLRIFLIHGKRSKPTIAGVGKKPTPAFTGNFEGFKTQRRKPLQMWWKQQEI